MQDPTEPASWIQTGGVLAFALLVLYIVRELQPILRGVRDELFELRVIIAAMLERDRMRDTMRPEDVPPFEHVLKEQRERALRSGSGREPRKPD